MELIFDLHDKCSMNHCQGQSWMRNVELKTNERKTKLIHNQQNSQGRINNYTVKIHKNMLLRQLVIFFK